MAKQEATKAPEPKTEVELLQEKIAAMREAQKVFATFTEEQVDKIFFEGIWHQEDRRAGRSCGRGYSDDEPHIYGNFQVSDLSEDKKCHHHQPASPCKEMYH